MQCTDEPCLAEKKMTRLTIQMEKLAKEKLIRRSTRDPNVSVLDRHDLTVLLNKIEKNHPSTVILKIKNHIQSDINSVVFDAIIEALWKNRVCQVSGHCKS
jgi:Ca2+-binding EF-hand superfamily protein